MHTEEVNPWLKDGFYRDTKPFRVVSPYQATGDQAPSLLSRDYKDPPVVKKPQSVVRRLTPMECERLQGFPDGWTDIPWKGKPHAPDGFRHRVCGNSMCVNVMRWVGERIAAVEAGKEFQDYGSVKDRGDNGESPPLAQEGGG